MTDAASSRVTRTRSANDAARGRKHTTPELAFTKRRKDMIDCVDTEAWPELHALKLEPNGVAK